MPFSLYFILFVVDSTVLHQSTIYNRSLLVLLTMDTLSSVVCY
uniref:Uncharacterized protein n=1 Tax=Rhizophora mucronata TaxID=61149 RepID=A0A2P2KLP6_RHIMU